MVNQLPVSLSTCFLQSSPAEALPVVRYKASYTGSNCTHVRGSALKQLRKWFCKALHLRSWIQGDYHGMYELLGM